MCTVDELKAAKQSCSTCELPNITDVVEDALGPLADSVFTSVDFWWLARSGRKRAEHNISKCFKAGAAAPAQGSARPQRSIESIHQRPTQLEFGSLYGGVVCLGSSVWFAENLALTHSRLTKWAHVRSPRVPELTRVGAVAMTFPRPQSSSCVVNGAG